MQAWILLVAAIVCEVIGTTSMKLSDGFRKVVPSISLFVFYGLSFTALTLSLRTIDLSVAYAIWAAVGTALIATIGIVVFHESVSALKVISLILIIAGVVGLNLSGAGH
jgi:small multidrug resistance pump